MIVEDDPVLLRHMSRELRLKRFDVLGALHYDAAVEHLTTSIPVSTLAVACIHLELPTSSGYELCEYLRGPLGLRQLPILVTSDSSHPEAMASAEEAGASAFLRRPFGMQELLQNVDALLDRVRQSERDLQRLRLG